MKTLKKNLIFCLMFGILSCKSQSYIEKYIPEYLDFHITTKITDSLRSNNGIKYFIIYQTNVDKKIAIDSLFVKNDTIVVSYLLWEEKGLLNSYLITDNCIYKNVYSLNNNQLFNYSFFSQLWLRKDENNKYIPQFNEPYNKDIVVYLTPDYVRFFEIGENTYYRLNEKRNIFRKEYISLLKSVISQFNNKWVRVLNNEKRWWGYENPSMDIN